MSIRSLYEKVNTRKKDSNKRKILLSMVVVFSFIIPIIILQFSSIYLAVDSFEELKKGFQLFNKDNNDYDITASFDEESMTLSCTEKVTYINKTNKNLDSIYFHLYPNAFKTLKNIPFPEDELHLAYSDGFKPGSIDIETIKSSSSDLSFLILGKGNSILKVNLQKELEAGERTVIYLEYKVTIPPCNARFGYGNKTINLGNWYPIACVNNDKKWNLEPYYDIGDPFYSDIGDYHVVVTMPQEYVLVTSGDLIKRESMGINYKWTYSAKDVRDFAMTASKGFKLYETALDGIDVRSYFFNDDFAELSLNSAKDSVEIFNDLFGKYPYKHFSVTASNFYIGGMEYPKLVFIDESLYNKENKDILEYIIVHETAHQWWYGIVGNDEISEAWLDEALTEYSTMLYYEVKYGKEKMEKMYQRMIVGVYNMYRNGDNPSEENLLRSLNQFKNSREYQALVYCKGAMFIHNLRDELSDEVFFNVLKVYFDKYKFENATTKDFLEVCEMVSDKELDNLFEKWLSGKNKE